MSENTLDSLDESLVVKLNHIIEMHYPIGEVDYVETIRSCMALATAYQRALEGHSPTHANMIADSAKAICEWMANNKH